MTRDTVGDCPLCGHQESSYTDWRFLGHRRSPQAKRGTDSVRVWECLTCHALVTRDSRFHEGSVQAFEPEP